MARTIQAIFDEIITEKETFSSLDELVPNPDSSQTFLDDLTSSSKVAIHRLLFWVVAFAIFTHEVLLDQFKLDVEARALEIIPATIRFYVIESLKFQIGDNLEFDEDTQKFAYDDSTSSAAIAKQIIAQASARDINQVVTIKLAKDDGSGGLEKLTGTEKTAFEGYLDDFKIAGTKTLVISDDPDVLKTAYTIQFDPQVMKPDGSLIEDGSFPVQEAMNGYIAVPADGSPGGLPFDSTFRVQDLTDAIQAARGVVNSVADVVEAKFGALPFSDILAVNTEDYLPNAGYLVTEPSPILVLTPAIYDPSITYAIGVNTRFEGIVFVSNVAIVVPEAFDPTKWDTVSNLTFISV